MNWKSFAFGTVFGGIVFSYVIGIGMVKMVDDGILIPKPTKEHEAI